MKKEDLFVLFLLIVILVMVYIFTGFSGDYGKPTGYAVSNKIAGESTVFSLNVTNFTNSILHPKGQYIFSTNNSGTWTNDFPINFTSTPEWANVTKALNSTIGLIIGYRWYLTDNEGNSDDTEVFILKTISDTISPIFLSIPDDASISYGRGLSTDFDADDETGFDSYSTNWTHTFQINSEGILTNSSLLLIGNYSINITINDTSGNLNSTLYFVEVTQAIPSLTISGTSPITYGSEASVEGMDCPSQLTCKLYRGGTEVNTLDTEVLEVGTYNYVYNTTGNQNYTYASKSFILTVKEEISDDEEDDDENGDNGENGENGAETTPIISQKTTKLTPTEISNLTLNPNDTEQITWSVKNTGTEPVSACALKATGDFASWISPLDETKNLNPGEEKTFVFDLIIPEETEEGSYTLSVSVECSETAASKNLAVEVIKKKLDFNIISADRTRNDRVRVLYSLEELSGNDQDVVFTFSLVDANNIEVGRIEVNQSIDANSSDEFRTNINIDESLLPINETTNKTLESELTLNVNFNSQIYSSSIQEKVLIGAPIGGFAIFGEGVGTTGSIIILVVIILVLGIVFLVVRKIRKPEK